MALVNSCWHNRYITSNHGTWSTARDGYNERKDADYQRPENILIVSTGLIATYIITRAYMNFNTAGVPTVTVAKLGIYVTSLTGIVGDLIITKGLWDEPVIDTDFLLQTPEVTSLGSIAQSALVLNQYNWIDLNAAGIAWINQKAVEINQHESYDWAKTAYLLFYPPYWRSESFTPQNSHTLTRVRLRLRRVGSPGTLNIHIRAADASHLPTGPDLATGSIDGNTLITTGWGDWYLIDLGAGAALTAGTEYCVILEAPSSDSSNYVEWIGAIASEYPNGMHGLSSDNGVTWAQEATNDCYFIEYETATVGGTKFCLRTSFDVSDSPPSDGQVVHFYSAQKGTGYLPVLDLTYAAAGASASPAGKLVAAHFI